MNRSGPITDHRPESTSHQLLIKLDELKREMERKTVNHQKIPKKIVKHSQSMQLQRELSTENSMVDEGSQEDNKMATIRRNIIGLNTRYISPSFNIELETIYADHTATNRAYEPIECMVRYAKRMSANPHTEFSQFGKYSTELMHYAQKSLLRSFNVSQTDYVALPTGSGSTGAIEKAIKILKSVEQSEKPIVYLTPYEHHSNILPWVEYYDSVNELAHDNQGNLLLEELERQLISTPSKSVIVTASAASNVTSKITDLKGLNNVIKNVRRFKQVVFSVDCAAFCCHQELNLKIYDQIDFAHLSPHKNLGGAQSCGILVARKAIMKNVKPTFPGGGTVAFVKGYSKTDVTYSVNIFDRQIAGTPPFLAFYRAALSYELLKDHIGYDSIHKREEINTKRFMQKINQANQLLKDKGMFKKIIMYGDQDFKKRANVFTFNMQSGGKLVHHSFASLVFTDVFGIQLRSGCFCAGPYGMKLLELDEETAQEIEQEVMLGILKSKPGYLRLDLTFYMQPYEIDYLANALIAVTEHCQNMEVVYTICTDGEIKRHNPIQNFGNQTYSLNNAFEAEKTLKEEHHVNKLRIVKRKETLDKQFERGLAIIMNPVAFLRSQKQK